MSKRNSQKFHRYEVTAIQLECSNQIYLSTILRSLDMYYNSIIGIIRVADYRAKIYDSTVFVYFTDTFEVESVIQRERLLIGGQIVKISHPSLVVANANIINNYTNMEMKEIAANGFTCAIAVMNLKINKAESNTVNTMKFVEILEKQERITGFKFAYCERSHFARNFGTLLTFHPSIMEKKFKFNGVNVTLEIPRSIPILIYHTHSNLLKNKRCSVTPYICTLNYLHANLADPSRSIHPVLADASWIERCCQKGDTKPIHNEAIKLLNNGLRLAEREKPGMLRLIIHATNSGRAVEKAHEELNVEISDISSDDKLSIGDDYELTEEGEIRCPAKIPRA
ncbi:hypothetical protein PVAND_003369 [Polypedilum vanderplanki]|uniref:Uncharacterized protein n=1 Tax=Polypedilum vanderplanki TaxID=319348 RepID=A0A9J6BUU4_POLVA|nr:hypothetical protein PVAND_003369 [Polypedilum vanderplanki]